MIQSKFTEGVVGALLLRPQVVQNTTVNGDAVVEPWKIGRQMGVTIISAALASGVSFRTALQGRQRSDGTWVNLTEPDGAGNIGFTQQVDGGELDTEGEMVGSLDLTRLDSTTYDAIRIAFTETGNVAADVASIGHITDLYTHPSGETDDLWTSQRSGT